ncbi:MAG: metallophosphoesterase family protein [Treponema sp.]|nr:metallophosphoesterase family protein [Candidatus Treponema equifaecale]
MKLYISDMHFFHENVMRLDGRDFADVHEMNKFMIEQWNAKVKGGDQVIVLGDMFWSKDPKEVNSILNRLNGKICLIEGNHDNRWLKSEGVNFDRFEWIKPYAEFNDNGNSVIVSHYPVFCYNHQYLKNDDGTPRTFMLYGHVHNTHDEVLVNQFQEMTRRTVLKGSKQDRTIPSNMINCFCKFSNYMPMSLKEWISIDKKRREQMSLPVKINELPIPDEM